MFGKEKETVCEKEVHLEASFLYLCIQGKVVACRKASVEHANGEHLQQLFI